MTVEEAIQARIESERQRIEALERAARLESETIVNVGEAAAKMVASIMPGGMPVTPPEVYRAHIFKTEIAPAMKAFGFDRRYWQDNLFVGARPKTKESKQAWTAGVVSGYLLNVGAIVVLTGERGLGKTTIAAQIAIERLWEDWHSARNDAIPTTCRTTSYRKMNNLVSKFKALYADFGAINIDQLEDHRDFICGAIRTSTGGLVSGGVDLLIIDELNEASEDSRFKDRILTDIVDRRYSRGLDTILITNQKDAEFKATTNASILDRLNEHGDIIACEWESFREQNHHDPSI